MLHMEKTRVGLRVDLLFIVECGIQYLEIEPTVIQEERYKEPFGFPPISSSSHQALQISKHPELSFTLYLSSQSFTFTFLLSFN